MTQYELPPLPEPVGFVAYPSRRWEVGWTSSEEAYEESQMIAYGQQCYKLALDKAAMNDFSLIADIQRLKRPSETWIIKGNDLT